MAAQLENETIDQRINGHLPKKMGDVERKLAIALVKSMLEDKRLLDEALRNRNDVFGEDKCEEQHAKVTGTCELLKNAEMGSVVTAANMATRKILQELSRGRTR